MEALDSGAGCGDTALTPSALTSDPGQSCHVLTLASGRWRSLSKDLCVIILMALRAVVRLRLEVVCSFDGLGAATVDCLPRAGGVDSPIARRTLVEHPRATQIGGCSMDRPRQRDEQEVADY